MLHAGDDRRADYDGARAAGLKALWLHRDAAQATSPDTIADLGVLPEMTRGVA